MKSFEIGTLRRVLFKKGGRTCSSHYGTDKFMKNFCLEASRK